MTTEIPETGDTDRDATDSTIYSIVNNLLLNGLIHDMLHRTKSVDDYLKRLEGLIRVFWGNSTPEKQNLDEVIWLNVMVQILPINCLTPIFNESMLQIKGENIEIDFTTDCDKYPT